jgi:hypothetical protein
VVPAASVAFEEFPRSVHSHTDGMNSKSVVCRSDGSSAHGGFAKGRKIRRLEGE